MDHKIQLRCPYCKSPKTQKIWKVFVLSGALLCVFIITLPLGVILLIMGSLSTLFPKTRKQELCLGCKRTFIFKLKKT